MKSKQSSVVLFPDAESNVRIGSFSRNLDDPNNICDPNVAIYAEALLIAATTESYPKLSNQIDCDCIKDLIDMHYVFDKF